MEASSYLKETQELARAVDVAGDRYNRAVSEFARLLASETTIQHRLIADVMTDIYGGTDVDGAWSIQSAYNAIETALVKRILARRPMDVAESQALIAKLVPQNRRTDTRELLQQFSTPPHIAHLAATCARIVPSDIVLEPSSGTGILAAYAKVAGARLSLNEIDEQRAKATSGVFGVEVTRLDAGSLAARYRGTQPTVVLMNPPFSQDGIGKGADIGLLHVAQAFALLVAGGRLVAIVGSFQHPTIAAKLWAPILEAGSLRAAMAIDGAEYAKMGTAFPTAVVVVDKERGLSADLVRVESTSVGELARLLPALERTIAGASAEIAPIALTQTLAKISKKVPPYRAQFADVQEVHYRYVDNEAGADKSSSGPFVAYRPHVEIEGAQEHPATLVESAALGSVQAPAPAALTRLPSRALNRLSVAQVESVIYAASAHDRTIDLNESVEDEETGVRRTAAVEVRGGIMLGHGTGYGKGRVCAGIVLSNFVEGRRTAVWVSESQSLLEDATRDWVDVTGAEHAHAILNVSSFKANDKLPERDAIFFMTYATLRSEARQNSRARVDQLVERLGADFEGVLVFDECHNLANALSTEGLMGKTQASKQGMAGLELQRRLPKARVVYTSATSASKLEAFCYAPRLGLWGNGKAFATRDGFMTSLSAGGTAAMELLCRDAKTLGVYLATSLSLEGVTYERLEHQITPDQEELYNAIAEAWRAIYLNAEAALDIGEGGSDMRRAARGQLELARVRTLQAVMTSLKMPTVIAHMEESLAAGKSIVVQLTNTYEASMKRSLAKQADDDADLELLDLSPKDIIGDYLLRAFPTQQYRTEIGPDNVERSVPVTDEHGMPLANPEAVARRDDLIAKVNGLLCPDGPMEILIDHFGSERVAEVTGRKKRVVRKLVNGEYQRVVEERSESANLAETAAFNAGKKCILIFSEAAGGTGRSYHASRTVENQQQRYHYLLQTGWRSDRAIQGLGRTHRTNQAVTPHWLLCTLDIPGERRFISTIAKRVESLGACTRGQRDAAGTSLFSAGDSLENRYGNEAVTALLSAIAYSEIEGFDYHRWLEQTNLALFKEDGSPPIAQITVSRFLNKVLACDVADQRMIMEILLERLAAIIATAKAKGVYDTGIVTLKALAIERVEDNVVYVEPTTNAQTRLVKLRVTVNAHTTTFGTALSSVRKSRDRYGNDAAGFREDDELGVFGWYQVASSVFEGKQQTTYAVVTPRRRELTLSVPSGEEHNEDAAHGLWELALANSNETITYHEYVMTGTLLPIYDRLPNDQAKVYRIVLDTGASLLGRVIPREHLATVVANLGIEQQTRIEDLLDALADGHKVVLNDNSMLVRRMVSGIKRLEFMPYVTSRYIVRERLIALGFTHERVNYVDRYAAPPEREQAIVTSVLEHWSLRAISK